MYFYVIVVYLSTYIFHNNVHLSVIIPVQNNV